MKAKIGLANWHIPYQAPLGYKYENKKLAIDYITKDVVESLVSKELFEDWQAQKTYMLIQYLVIKLNIIIFGIIKAK